MELTRIRPAGRQITAILSAAVVLFSSIFFSSVSEAAVTNYEDALKKAQEESVVVVFSQTTDQDGKIIQELSVDEDVYVAQKTLPLFSAPGGGNGIVEFKFGALLKRIGVLENGYSHVLYEGSTNRYEGYVSTRGLSDSPVMERMQDNVTISLSSNVLDYPSRRDGEIIGEVYPNDVVTRTGSYHDIWTRIWYTDYDGNAMDGYVLTNTLKGYEASAQSGSGEDDGVLHQSQGGGVFKDAVEGVTQAEITTSGGVLIGSPESVTETVKLTPLGVFRITHYCPCSICCGPYADGITSTGVTAVTNHTIAVQPSQIPYGSRVAINGQVYYAEDCGGAIKENCIDVYVATHAEALEKGVFYTEVYLIS